MLTIPYARRPTQAHSHITSDLVQRVVYLVLAGIQQVSDDRVALVMSGARQSRIVQRHTLRFSLPEEHQASWVSKADRVHEALTGRPRANRKTKDRLSAMLVAASLEQYYDVDTTNSLIGGVLSYDAIRLISDLDIVNDSAIASEWRAYGSPDKAQLANLYETTAGFSLMTDRKEPERPLSSPSMTVEVEVLEWSEAQRVFDVDAPVPHPQRPADPQRYSFQSLLEEIAKPII